MSKSTTYHKRVIVLNYENDSLPKMPTDDLRKWHEALGRMVAFAMQTESQEDTVQLVRMGFSKNPQGICANYYPARVGERDENGFRIYNGSAEHAVGTLEQKIIAKGNGHQPFMMGAVLHSYNNEWWFHS